MVASLVERCEAAGEEWSRYRDGRSLLAASCQLKGSRPSPAKCLRQAAHAVEVGPHLQSATPDNELVPLAKEAVYAPVSSGLRLVTNLFLLVMRADQGSRASSPCTI